MRGLTLSLGQRSTGTDGNGGDGATLPHQTEVEAVGYNATSQQQSLGRVLDDSVGVV